MRTFEDTPAVRSRVPLLVGLVGPSGTGKTFSALRLATGIQRVTGGDIVVVDTEHRRALHYADRFTFRHIDFQPPYGSLDYLAVLEHCVKRNSGVVVVDQMSSEHDGPGGYLDFHEQEVKRLLTCGFNTEFAAQIPAWGKPAQARSKLIQGMLQLGVNAIFCFRAKEKVDMSVKGKVGNLGFMPIAGDSFVYEMTMKCLLLPGADGVPTWHPENSGEKQMCKLPIQFRDLFKDHTQLSEEIGQKLAEWAAGSSSSTKPAPTSPMEKLLNEYIAATTVEQWEAAEQARAAVWKRRVLKTAEQETIREASVAAKERIDFEREQAARTPQPSQAHTQADEVPQSS